MVITLVYHTGGSRFVLGLNTFMFSSTSLPPKICSAICTNTSGFAWEGLTVSNGEHDNSERPLVSSKQQKAHQTRRPGINPGLLGLWYKFGARKRNDHFDEAEIVVVH